MAMTTTGRPISSIRWTMGTCSELLRVALASDDDASTDINTSRRHYPSCTATYIKPHSAKKLFNVWNVGSMKGVTLVTSVVLVPQ